MGSKRADKVPRPVSDREPHGIRRAMIVCLESVSTDEDSGWLGLPFKTPST